MSWETVIGLEVHVQLSTKTKIFSSASTKFGSEPNSQASTIDLALPGTLPVLNEDALHFAIMFGLAIDAEICRESVFERKNYNHNFLNLLNNKYKISAKDANTLRRAIIKNTKIIFLNQSVWAEGKEYRQIHFSKNTIKTGHPRIYVRPLKIYLTK